MLHALMIISELILQVGDSLVDVVPSTPFDKVVDSLVGIVSITAFDKVVDSLVGVVERRRGFAR